MLFWPLFGNLWCPVVTMVTFSSNLINFERKKDKNLKEKKKRKSQKIQKSQKKPKKNRKSPPHFRIQGG